MGFQKIWYLQPPKRKLGTSKKMGTLSLDTKAAGAFQGGLEAKAFLIRFSTFIWPGYHVIILEFGQLY